ncbi:MAG: DUF4838 domain-containing protein [Phycisphaeraceae bacterium]
MAQFQRLRSTIALVLMSVLTLGLAPAAAAVTLVEDGQPRAAIVVQADAPKSQAAAETIQRYIEKMSGATLPLVVEGKKPAEAVGPNRIHVGHTTAAEGQQVPAGFDPTIREDAFENEGYVLRTLDDNTLLVAGNNDGPYKGTRYAAYALLEELGCRFYFPGEWGEVVPERATITAPTLDRTERPDFAMRHINHGGWIPVTREESEIYGQWATKIGFSERNIYPVAGDGFLAFLIPPDEYFESNPEYFAMNRAGERHRGRTTRHTMLCLSNEQMYQEAVRNLEKAFAGEKEMRNVRVGGWGDAFGISPPDGTPYCYCDDCQAQSQNFRYPRYGYFDKPMQSEEYFGFSARLAREFPDTWVGTMAYSLREMPPQGVDLPDNVAVTHAPITADVLHPNDTELWRRSQFVEILRQWRAQTPHVMIYDYNPGFLTGLFVPERDAENMAINAPIYREMDIKGLRREGRKAFMQTWISYYVTAKLLWDADADVDAIKDDFYTTFFGSDAAPHVRAWWDACAEALIDTKTQAHEDYLVNHIYTKQFTDDIHRHVEAALAADATDAQRERVEAFALIAENLEMYAAMHDAERRMDWAAAAQAAEHMVEIKEELHAIYPFFISPARRTRAYFAKGKAEHFRDMEAKTTGSAGSLVANLPLEMKFKRDPFNKGVIRQWYLTDHDDADWDTRDTYYLLEQQEDPINERGYYPDGHVWYRTTVDVPADLQEKPVNLYLGGIINEGWVWVNGQYVGHRDHLLWWHHRHAVDFDVTDMIEPGETNTIAVRVLNDPDEMGGLYRRGFLYSPNESAAQED